MTILAIILGWLLVNTWATLIICELDGTFISGWDDLLSLALTAVVSPWLFLLIRVIVKFFKKRG